MTGIDWIGTALGAGFLFLLSYMNKKGHHVPANWVLRSLLALMGGVFLAFSIVGVLLLNLASLFPSIIFGVLMILAIIGIVLGLSDRRADKGEIMAMVVLPLLFMAAAGPVAIHGQHLVTLIHTATEAKLGSLLGG